MSISIIPRVPSATTGGPMDIGNILGGIVTYGAQRFIDNRFSPGPDPSQPPVILPSLAGSGNPIGLPGMDVTRGDQPGRGYVWNPDANCGAGKWQKKSRRRRKRLATQTDLKDLAALKGVLGQGKAFETWIATHA